MIDLYGATLDLFAKLQHPGGRGVIDKTGLKGVYDIHLELASEEPATPSPDGAASEPPGASAVAATSRQLGLQFTIGRGPREFLIVDRIERPSAN